MLLLPTLPDPSGFFSGGLWGALGGVVLFGIVYIGSLGDTDRLQVMQIFGEDPGLDVFLVLVTIGAIISGGLSKGYNCFGSFDLIVIGGLAPFLAGNVIEANTPDEIEPEQFNGEDPG